MIEGDLDFLHEYEHLTLARLVLAQERGARRNGPDLAAKPSPLTAVHTLLGRLHDAAADTGREGSLLEIRMLQALAHAADGDRETALSVLGLALTQTPEPEGHVRLFLDEGDPMLDLLRDAAQVEGPPAGSDSGQKIKNADEEGREIGGSGPTAARAGRGDEPSAPQHALADPLSQREVEVLRLLDSELTGPQIAAELYVTLNTLRTHTKRIFTKLDVTTRAAAVRKAHEHGLI